GGGGGRLNPVETLQEEAICAICLDYFVDPVSIGCGHNFCRVCISQLWSGGGGERRRRRRRRGGGGGGGGRRRIEEEEEEEEEDEEEEEEMWPGGVGGDLFFSDDDDYGDVMEEDVEEVDEEEEEEEEDDDDDDDEEQVPHHHHHPHPLSPLLPPRPLQTFTCPQCRKTFLHKDFRPNLQLANMVQIIRQLHPHPHRLAPASLAPNSHNTSSTLSLNTSGFPLGSGGVGGGGGGGNGSAPGQPNLCQKHQEALKLFCEVDEEAICVVCRESRSHKHHSVVPIEEVVQDYKNKLQSHLEPLKKKLDAVLKQKSNEEEKITELRDKMKMEIKELEADFELLHQFLIGEQVLLLQQLEERYEALLAQQSSNLRQLQEHSVALSSLLAEAEDKSKQEGLQLLKVLGG
ncbi:TRI41 ligase, partial [Bucco capensis]|nr:TRI41 ligase [Bucco capensis]